MLSNTQIKAQAHHILTQSEFKTAQDKTPQIDWFSLISKWLHWQPPFAKENSQISILIFKLFIVLLFIAACALVLWVLFFWVDKLFHLFTPRKHTGVSTTERRIASLSYSKLSETALKEENYREAMHYLFLAAIAWVITEQLFHKTEYLTSREIAASLDLSKVISTQNVTALFHQMLNLDEPRWFGEIPTLHQDFEDFQGVYAQFQKQVIRHAH